MKNLNWKGIVVALVIKQTSSYATGLILSFLGAFKIRSLGLNPRDTINYVNHVPQVYYWSILISLIASLLCGYIAAGRIRKYAILNAFVMALLYFMLRQALESSSFRVTPTWFQTFAPIVSFVGVILGGYIRSVRASRVLETPQSPLPEVPRAL